MEPSSGAEHQEIHHQQQHGATTINAALSGAEIVKRMRSFARKDEDNDKTWTRIIVENYLSKSSWYFPMKDKEGGPSLSEAYAFYEHVTLPRHFVGSEDTRAEPGESIEPTRLFDPFRTNAGSFNEWGIGMDLYFTTLKMVSLMLFIAGLINLRNIYFYASVEYSADRQDGVRNTLLKGSALCTTYEWVVCTDCKVSDFNHDDEELSRIAVAEDGTVLAKHNDCDGANFATGTINFITFFFLLASMVFMSFYLRAREVRSDEDKLTSTDYSVVVLNPPPKALDPDEWRAFFQKFALSQVTCVTIALDNDQLLRKLTARRVKQNTLRLLLPRGTNMDDNEQVTKAVEELTRQLSMTKSLLQPLLEASGMVVPPKILLNSIELLAEEIKVLQTKEYNVSQVYVTFETEDGQRNALNTFSVGKMDIWVNRVNHVNPNIVFQGKVLEVEEPPEPDAVRWMDLSSTFLGRSTMWSISLIITVVALIVSGICVFRVREIYGPYMAGILVSVFNSIIPELVLFLLTYERHLCQGRYQTSLYVKITLFRWVNTAVLTKMVNPLTETLDAGDNDILPSIHAILISELLVTPILSLMDISSNFYKHVLAPRAQTQEQMNMYFLGTQCDIGERYTSLTNIMFVCFFYAALFPATLFYGAIILFIQHYADKFCLMRIWAWQPSVGSQLARFSRQYFFSGSLMTFVLVSAYTWVQYPFDNLCYPASDPSMGKSGVYKNVQVMDGSFLDKITVDNDMGYQFCSQSPLDGDAFPFPPTSWLEREDLKYMTDSQRRLVDMYGWTALVVVIGYILFAFGSQVGSYLLSLLKGTYQPSGVVQHVDFSSNFEIYGYVPQIRLPEFSFPLLACDVDDIDQDLIGWNDEKNSYDHHNMIFDVPYEGMKRRTRIEGNTRSLGQINDHSACKQHTETTKLLPKTNPVFSIVKHYPPPWLQKLQDSEKEVPAVEPLITKDSDGNGEVPLTGEAQPQSATHPGLRLFQNASVFLGGFLQGKGDEK